ncbi:phage major capsid protein [Eubacterium sp. AF17-7]|uniref:phage major capsid protein n=1 Tax=Eubacterium sp. AF17-7 TaxID=2293105 RepID=UPI000E5468C8|nr:phage major capsid protein [Eubacterium sp. AF17-7]RGG63428.1 phage major capsid protein [Eubacterium sp. AF17-7]
MRKKTLMKENVRKKVAEFRAENLKELAEQRAEYVAEMQKIVDEAKAEKRAMDEDEKSKFDELEKKIKSIDATIAAEQRARDLSLKVITPEKQKKTQEEEQRAQEEAEERAFIAFVKGQPVEERAGEIQLTQGNNGSIVPTHIANRIIKAVKDMVPYMTICDVINTNGKLSVPVYSEDDTNAVKADYVDEGTELVDNVGKFTTIDLNGYVVGALALVSKKLIANTDINVLDFIIQRVAEAMAEKLEEEFTAGTTKIKGIISTTKVVKTAASTAITYDELISVKHSLKQRYRDKAEWIMNPATYTAICKLKDANGQPYFKEDEYKILGRPVRESDSMPTMAAGKKAIIFAEPTGYTIKATTSIELTVLREKFATKNMLGVMAFGEYDAAITDGKKIAALQMKEA